MEGRTKEKKKEGTNKHLRLSRLHSNLYHLNYVGYLFCLGLGLMFVDILISWWLVYNKCIISMTKMNNNVLLNANSGANIPSLPLPYLGQRINL